MTPSNWLTRQTMLLGEGAATTLLGARVCIVGAGGVGGAAIEASVRAGIGHLLIVDHDAVEESNLNRQILATRSVIGQNKAGVAKDRALDINPNAEVVAAPVFYLPESRDVVFDFHPDFILDAVDTVTAKLDLCEQAARRGIGLISCLGTGNRLHPELLGLGDVYETAGCGCPLARIMRRELRRRGIPSQTVVFSREAPLSTGERTPGSISFVPPTAGFLMAGAMVRSLIGRA